LVISDYKIPQMLELDFIQKVREKVINFSTKIILISAYSEMIYLL